MKRITYLGRYGNPLRATLFAGAFVFAAGAAFVIGAPWLRMSVTAVVILAAGCLIAPSPDSRPLRSRLGAALGIAFALAFTLVLTELGARWVLPPRLGSTVTRFAPHREAIYAPIPGVEGHVMFRKDDDSMGAQSFRISSQGLRDREFGAKDPDEFRILLIGDSFTYGKCLEYIDTIGAVLESLLNEKPLTKRVTVMNGGVGGYGPWQEAIFLRERGLPLEPDIVVFQFLPVNDLADTSLRVGQLHEAFNASEMAARISISHYYDDWKARLEYHLWENSRLYRELIFRTSYRWRSAWLLNRIRPFHTAAFDALPTPVDRPHYMDVLLRQWPDEMEAGWTLVQEDILAMKEMCTAQGIGFMAYTLPGQESITEANWQAATEEAPGEDAYERLKDTRIATAFFRDEGIGWAPVLERMTSAPDPADLYFRRDGHLKPRGVRIVAQALAEHLSRKVLPNHGVVRP
jgi:hypothetical protein